MFVRSDEDNRSFFGRNGVAQPVSILQLGRNAQPEDADQLVDGPGAARAGEDDDRLGVAADCFQNQRAGVLAEPGGLRPVPLDSVWVLAYRGRTSLRMKSSTKPSARPEAV